jgi:RimJ/RimL family protein N-acetyltransferase
MSELHFPAPPLADETVLLRPWRETDVADGLMAFSDPIIQRFSWPQAPGPRPQARGRGVASSAVRLLAMWGFTTLGLARIELTCGPDNKASQRVAARCGFVCEGVMRSHMAFKGGRRNTVLFSLLPGELLAPAGPC